MTGFSVMHMHSRAGKSLLVLLIGCGIASLALGVGAGVFMAHRAQASSAHGKGKDKEEKKAVEVGSVYSLGEIVVNLADTSTMRYVKASVAFGFVEKVPEDQIKEQMPVLRDIVISVLTRKTFDQLHHKGGIERLKHDLLALATQRFHSATVAQVYLEAFAMQ